MNGKTIAGMGLACGICCALPMFLAAGALTVGAAALAGVAAGAVMAVCFTAYLVMRRRAPRLPGLALLTGFVLGAALSGLGLLGLAEGADRAATGLVAGGLALLTCVTLLRLPVHEPQSAG